MSRGYALVIGSSPLFAQHAHLEITVCASLAGSRSYSSAYLGTGIHLRPYLKYIQAKEQHTYTQTNIHTKPDGSIEKLQKKTPQSNSSLTSNHNENFDTYRNKSLPRQRNLSVQCRDTNEEKWRWIFWSEMKWCNEDWMLEEFRKGSEQKIYSDKNFEDKDERCGRLI